MKAIVWLGLVCALLCAAPPISTGTVSLQAHIVARAGFGDAPYEYGSPVIAGEAPAPVIVVAFDVAPNGVFVFDGIKNDVKVYALSGEYQRTIKTDCWEASETSDMLVSGGEIHLLVEAARPPGDGRMERPRFELLSFGVDLAEAQARYVVDNPKIGTTVSKLGGPRSEAKGTVELSWQSDVLALFDHGQQLSFPLIRAGDPVDPADAGPRIGSVVGPFRVRENLENGTIELLDDRGQPIRALPGEGVLIALASDTEHYAMSRVDARPGLVVTVHSASGLTVGEAFVPFRGRWDNNPPSYWARFEFHDGSLYEILVNDEGVHLVRWRAELALR